MTGEEIVNKAAIERLWQFIIQFTGCLSLERKLLRGSEKKRGVNQVVMESTLVLLSVASVWGLGVMTPGPNFFITLKTAIGESRRSAFFVVLGITTGTLVWTLSASFGIVLLFRAVPWLYFYLKLLGGVYITFLGIKFLLSKSGNSEENIILYPENSDLMRNYRLGLMTNLTNPKSAAFVAGIFAGVMPPDASCLSGIMTSLMMCSMSALWYASVAYIFSSDRFRNVHQNFKTRINRIAGIIFVGFGLRLVADR